MSSHLPNLVIIGVHKSATTSLFMYLKAHPDVFASPKKEIHYFTPLRYGRSLKPIEEYSAYFTNYSNERFILEASPSYFYGKEAIIDEMQKILGSHKVILVLREPIARVISFYRHLKSKLLIHEEETLSVFLKSSIEYIGKPFEENNPYSRAIQEGLYIDYLEPWLKYYGSDIKIVYTEDLKTPKVFMADVAEWLSIDASIYEDMDFEMENKSVFAKNKLLHKCALWINNKLEQVLRSNPRLKKKIRNLYFAVNASKTDEKADIEQISTLKSIYAEPNRKLYDLLELYSIRPPVWAMGKN